MTETYYSRLRDSLDAGLTRMEQSAKPFDEAILEVAKAAAAWMAGQCDRIRQGKAAA